MKETFTVVGLPKQCSGGHHQLFSVGHARWFSAKVLEHNAPKVLQYWRQTRVTLAIFIDFQDFIGAPESDIYKL